ncbi:matrix protein [Babaco nucleorhabdovirus 1]|uniref:Matrix protein n=1 Tax=Babaco nucleorhabdovirus 1 TaxID=3053260 RepID=A0A9Y1YS30_9RHAB|nr:matrix protein [Babaco nucleorhabdovirus 1]
MIPVIGSRRPIRREIYFKDREGDIKLQQETTGILASLNYIITVHIFDDKLNSDIEDHGISYPELFKYVEDNIGLPPANPESIKCNPNLTQSQIKELIMLAKIHAIHTKAKVTTFTQQTDHSDATPTLYLKVGESILQGDHDPHVVEIIYKDTDPLAPGEYHLNMKRQYRGGGDTILCEISFALFIRTPPRDNSHISSRLNIMVLLSKYSSELKQTITDPLKSLLKRKSEGSDQNRHPNTKKALLPSMLRMLSPGSQT